MLVVAVALVFPPIPCHVSLLKYKSCEVMLQAGLRSSISLFVPIWLFIRLGNFLADFSHVYIANG